MRKFGLPFLSLILLGLDQWVKAYTVANIEIGEVKPFLPGLFSLTYLRNYGAAFSSLQNQQWLFYIVTALVLPGAMYYYFKNMKQGSYYLLIGLALIISGTIGNFIDRVTLGYVIDMVQLDFMNFAVFNVADSCLTVGVLFLAIGLMKEEE